MQVPSFKLSGRDVVSTPEAAIDIPIHTSLPIIQQQDMSQVCRLRLASAPRNRTRQAARGAAMYGHGGGRLNGQTSDWLPPWVVGRLGLADETGETSDFLLRPRSGIPRRTGSDIDSCLSGSVACGCSYRDRAAIATGRPHAGIGIAIDGMHAWLCPLSSSTTMDRDKLAREHVVSHVERPLV